MGNITGTTLEGEIQPDLLRGDMDLQEIEQWLAGIKAINRDLRVIFDEREL